MLIRQAGIVSALALGSAACVTSPTKSEPVAVEVISLSDAVAQVQRTLATAKMRPNEDKAGLLPSKATVTFVMAAKRSGSETDKFSVGVALPIGLTVGGDTEATNASEHSASNTIVLEFVNALVLPADTVLGKIGQLANWKSVNDVKDQTNDAAALNLRTATE